MSCRDTIHLICWYLEGKLSPSVSKDIEQHLGSCANCRVVLSAATTTLDQYFATLTESNSTTSTQAA
jgi:predicted anti-sigma-YlaC factor YlaD